MRRRLGLGLVVVPVLAATWGILGCSSPDDPWAGEAGRPRVVVTIAPLHSFVRAVAGDRAAIRCLCTTTGPHHYQTDTRDARVFGKADLFFAVGLRLDDTFADALRSMARRPDLPTIKLGKKLPEKSLLEIKHEHKHAHGEGHHHGKWDPHVWLGVPEVIAMVGVIRDELCEIDGDHAADYRKNAGRYIDKLRRLHSYGEKLLRDKKVKRIVSFHEALGYFARSFGLEIADVIEQGPGDEPSAGHLADIVKLCQDTKKPIGAITVEPQYPKSSSAGIIQRELKSKGVRIDLVEIDPLETADVDELRKEGSAWYETRMRKNLERLASKLP